MELSRRPESEKHVLINASCNSSYDSKHGGLLQRFVMFLHFRDHSSNSLYVQAMAIHRTAGQHANAFRLIINIWKDDLSIRYCI
jgi:hypothetical protein